MELAFEVWFSEVSPEKVVRAKGPLSQSPGRWLSSNWGLESPKSWGILPSCLCCALHEGAWVRP